MARKTPDPWETLIRGDAETALVAYQAMIARGSSDRSVVPQLNNAAICLLDLGRYPEALAMAERATAVRPDSVTNKLAGVVWCAGKVVVAHDLLLDSARRLQNRSIHYVDDTFGLATGCLLFGTSRALSIPDDRDSARRCLSACIHDVSHHWLAPLATAIANGDEPAARSSVATLDDEHTHPILRARHLAKAYTYLSFLVRDTAVQREYLSKAASQPRHALVEIEYSIARALLNQYAHRGPPPEPAKRAPIHRTFTIVAYPLRPCETRHAVPCVRRLPGERCVARHSPVHAIRVATSRQSGIPRMRSVAAYPGVRPGSGQRPESRRH